MRLAGALRTSRRRDDPCARRALFNWITIAEPAAVSINGWVTGRFPPAGACGRRPLRRARQPAVRARAGRPRAIGELQPSAAVGMSTGCSRVYDFDRICLDLLAAPSLEVATATSTSGSPCAGGSSRPHFAAAVLAPVRPAASRRCTWRRHSRPTGPPGGGRSGGSGGPHRGGSSASSPSRAPRRPSISWPSSIPARSLRATPAAALASPRGAGISPTRSPRWPSA